MASRFPHRSQNKSQKLASTLQELEAAFSDWDALSDEDKEKAAIAHKAEYRERTRRLLGELKKQLAELNDEEPETAPEPEKPLDN